MHYSMTVQLQIASQLHLFLQHLVMAYHFQEKQLQDSAKKYNLPAETPMSIPHLIALLYNSTFSFFADQTVLILSAQLNSGVSYAAIVSYTNFLSVPEVMFNKKKVITVQCYY